MWVGSPETSSWIGCSTVTKAGLPLCATEAQLAKYPDMKRLPQCEAERAKS